MCVLECSSTSKPQAEGWPSYVFAAVAVLSIGCYAFSAATSRATHLRKHGLLDESLVDPNPNPDPRCLRKHGLLDGSLVGH